jgi:FkbM family methyltransferase
MAPDFIVASLSPKHRIMILEGGVWSVMQSLKMDEMIASNTNYDSFLRKVIPRSRAYNHERFEHTVSTGLKMVLDRRDYSQWRVFSGGLHINTKIFDFVPVNPFHFELIDIGANIGGYSVLFSNEIDVENFNIHLFEPNPLILSNLQENIKRLERANLAVNAIVNPYALGDKEGRLPLKINENHSGISTFGNTRRQFTKSVDVNVTLLDNYVLEKKLEHIDLIKLDVESCEPAVLNGARTTLSTFKPAIYFEYQKAWFDNYSDTYLTDLIYFLGGHGYIFYREAKDGTLIQFQLTSRTLQDFNHLNILAIIKKN